MNSTEKNHAQFYSFDVIIYTVYIWEASVDTHIARIVPCEAVD